MLRFFFSIRGLNLSRAKFQRSKFAYSNAKIKDEMRKNPVEFCESIVPKRNSIVIEFEEDPDDDSLEQNFEQAVNLPSCNGTFVEYNLQQPNSDITNGILVDDLNTVTPGIDHNRKSAVPANSMDIRSNAEHPIMSVHLPIVKMEVGTDNLPDGTDVTWSKINKSDTDNRFLNNAEQTTNIPPSSILANHAKMNEFNRTDTVESKTPEVLRKKVNGRLIQNENSQRITKPSQLGKFSGNCGMNDDTSGNEMKKTNGTIGDFKDEGNSRNSVPQR